MRTIARFMDARNTTEGKFLSVLLSVLLVFSFLNVTMFTDYANATDEEGEATEFVEPAGEPEAQAQPEDEADGPESEEPAEEVNETEPAVDVIGTDDEVVSDDTTKDTSETEEESVTEEVPAPEAFEGYAHVGNITVKVTAEAGVVPAGTEVHAKRVSAGAVREAVEEAVAEEGKALDGYEAIDVTLLKNGQEIQPDGKVNVCFFDANLEGEDVAVYHVADDASTVTEVDARQADADVQSFDVEHFSIYVVGTTSNIVTYEFYRGADDTIPVSIQSVKEGEEVFEPTAESLAGKRFLGWYAEGTDEPFVFGPVGAVAEPGKTIRVIARYGIAHHVFFMSDTTDDARVIWTKSAFEGDEITTDGVSYPLSGDESITGWYEDKNLSGDPVETLTMGDENVMLYPRIEKGCWVTYDSNGGSYVKKEFVAKDGHAAGAAIPTRPGYVFAGWYADGATSSFDFNTAISEDITLHAKWKGLETTYTIIYWVENPNYENPYLDESEWDKERYSFYDSKQLKARSGETVSFANLTSNEQGIRNVQDRLGSGFETGAVSAEDAVQRVNGDGSTVFSVFFDRKIVTLTFDYREGNSVLTCDKETHTHTNGKCYELICGKSESLFVHHHNNSCYDRSKPICGKEAHTHGTSCYSSRNVQVVAKYGADISNAWPENKNGKMDWKVSNSSNANGQVGLRTMPSSDKTFYDYSSSRGSSQAFYYVERLDGSGYDLHHTDKSSGSGYSVTEEEMYPITGFTLNTGKSAKRGDSYNNAKFYHDRNSYNLLFFQQQPRGDRENTVSQVRGELGGEELEPRSSCGHGGLRLRGLVRQ